MTYCALCGVVLEDVAAAPKLAVVISRKGEKAEPLALTRAVCNACIDNAQLTRVALLTILRRLASILPDAY